LLSRATSSESHMTHNAQEYQYVATAPTVPPRRVRPPSVHLSAGVSGAVTSPSDGVSTFSSSKQAAPLPQFRPVIPEKNFVSQSGKLPSSAAVSSELSSAKQSSSARNNQSAESTYSSVSGAEVTHRPPPLPDRPSQLLSVGYSNEDDDEVKLITVAYLRSAICWVYGFIDTEAILLRCLFQCCNSRV
jgi:hypothetical protein